MNKTTRNQYITQKFSVLILLSCFLMVFIFSSCAGQEKINMPVLEDYDTDPVVVEKNNLKLGASTKTYANMYLEAIQPILAEKGYTVEIIIYNDYIQPNMALANGDIDLNIFQHMKYLNNFKFEYDLDLSAITKIPTAAMGVYSKIYESLDELKDGAKIAIPSDATNLSRALIVLETAGLITIDKYIDKTKAVVDNITENPLNLQFYYFAAQELAQSLDGYDAALINGGFALSAGLKLSDAIYKEILAENYINVIAVKTSDLNKQFVQDIIDAVASEEFTNVIMDTNGAFSGFQFPR